MKSKTWHVYAEGPLACFTAIEAKAERFSYAVPTPSAIEGFLRGILGKNEIQWHIVQTRVLSRVAYLTLRRNELKDFGNSNPVYIEDARTQRTTSLLRDPCYIFTAYLTIKPSALTQDIIKYESMFERRMASGQHEYPPYFGLRELVASRYRLIANLSEYRPINFTHNLGRMFYGHDYDGRGGVRSSKFWDAKIVNGVVTYPSREEIFGRSS